MIDLSVQKIKKAFEEGKDILDGISFDVNEGERVGLLGKMARARLRCSKSSPGNYRKTRVTL